MTTWLPRTILVTALACWAAVAHAQDGAAIERAKAAIVAGQYADALAAAQDAEQADPASYQAAYYVAMAQLALKQYGAAAIEAKKALSLAPDDAKPAVQKLVDLISMSEKTNDYIVGADQLLAAGDIGKAAELYSHAFGVKRDNPAIALKAADLYANRLGQPVEAAELYRLVIRFFPNDPAADTARTLLRRLESTVRQIAAGKLQTARARDYADRLDLLRDAARADPTNPDIFYDLIDVRAWSDYPAGVIENIRAVQQLGPVNIGRLAALPFFRVMLADDGFAAKVSAVIGAGNLATLRELAAQRAASDQVAKAQAAVDGLRTMDTGRYTLTRVMVDDVARQVCIDVTLKNRQHRYHVWDHQFGTRGGPEGFVVYQSADAKSWDARKCAALNDVTAHVQ